MLFTTYKEFEKINDRYHLSTTIGKYYFNITITEGTYEDYAIHIYINGTNELEMSSFGTLEKAKNFAYGFLMGFECQRNLIVENI